VIKKLKISFFMILLILLIILITVFTCTMPVSSSGSSNESKDNKTSETLSSENDQSRAVVTQINPYARYYGSFKCFWFMADNNWTEFTNAIGNDQNYALIANMQTKNGSDPCSLRFDNSKSKITAMVEEEKSYDDEISHGKEIIGGFLINARPYNTDPDKDRIFDKTGAFIGRAFYLDKSQSNADQTHTISVSGFITPIVFANIRTYNSSNQAHIRITEVKRTAYKVHSITFKIEEWAYQDGKHSSERIDFVVLEKGIHLIGTGTNYVPYLLEVGTYKSSNDNINDKKVKLMTHFNEVPVIITQTQTYNGSHQIVTRNKSIDTADDSFVIRINEEEKRWNDGDTTHNSETIGYLALGSGKSFSKSNVVTNNGNLKIKNNTLCNKNGNPVQLKGMSMFWQNWEDGYKFANKQMVQWLVNDWGIDVLRVAVGVLPIDPKMTGNLIEPVTGIMEELRAYSPSTIDKTMSFKRACSIVDACIDSGIYVILDWHVHDAFYVDSRTRRSNKTGAYYFFQKMSQKYGKYPNVIFEVWNEPGTFGHIKNNPMYEWESYDAYNNPSDLDIKSYSEYIIKVIRDYDSDSYDNIVIVPTPCWDQRPKDVFWSDNNDKPHTPIDDDHVMYCFHFYAGSHPVDNGDYGLPDGDSFNPPLEYQPNYTVVNGIKSSLGKIPIFISEWGTSLYDGGQPETSTDAYLVSSDAWIDYLADNNVSWCNWSISDKNEGAAALKPGAGRYGSWSKWALSKSGEYIRGKIKE